MDNATLGGNAIFCIYTEMQLAIAVLYFRKFLAPRGVEPCFVLFQTAGERFRTVDLSRLPGRHFSFRNELNHSILFPDLAFLDLREENDVRYFAYPNSPFLTHESLGNYFAAQQPIQRIVITDGASIHASWPLKEQLTPLIKYLVRRYVNRVPHLSNKLLRSPNAIGNVDTLISTAPIDLASTKFVDVQSLYADEDNVRSVLELFNVADQELDVFVSSDLIFFGQPRFKGRIDARTYFDVLERIVDIVRKRGGTLIIKAHPVEDASVYDFLVGDGVIISETMAPAEFLLSSLRNKVILSFYSSVSLMSSNGALTHIWLKNLLTNEIPANADGKILIVESLEEVEKTLDRVMGATAAPAKS